MVPRPLRTLPGRAGAETGGGTEVETCGARPLMGDRGLRPPLPGGRPERCDALVYFRRKVCPRVYSPRRPPSHDGRTNIDVQTLAYVRIHVHNTEPARTKQQTTRRPLAHAPIAATATRLAARAASAALEAKWAEQKYCSVQLLLTIDFVGECYN